ncbi:TonB-dependent receptor [soil metagenome]
MKMAYLVSGALAPLLAALLPTGALAQQASPTNAPPRVDQVEEIIVTAQRVAQSLQDVPVSVQAITGRELERRALGDVIQLQMAVPSLQTGTDNTFSLRGVGSLVSSPSVDSSVGVAIDEVSLAIPIFMNNFGFEDLSQFEVLLGPQGLLFGRNASAGLLNIVTNRPVLGQTSGRLYGEEDYRDTVPGGKDGRILKGTINLPLSETAALRLNALYSRQDPIATVIAASPDGGVADYQERIGAKAKLLYEPNDRLSLYLIGDYAKQFGVGGVYDRTYRTLAPGSFVGIFVGADGVTAGPDNLEYGSSSPTNQILEGGGFSAKVAYNLTDAITVSNIAAYRNYHVHNSGDNDFTSFDGLDNQAILGRYEQFSNELRASLAPGGLIDGQVGLYYFSTQVRTELDLGGAAFGVAGPFESFNNPLIGTDVYSAIASDSYAAFGQANIHPTEALTLIAGGRFTRDELSLNLRQNQKFYPAPLGVPNYATQQSTNNDDLSWKVGAQYDLAPDVMAYVTYGKGYKGPAFNDSASSVNQQLAIGPETVHSLELGLKSILLDRKLRLNIAAFHQDFEDFQVQGYDSASQTIFTANAANVISQGVEITAEARPVNGLTLNAAMTVLDSTFKEYTTDRCYAGQPNCSAQGVSDSSGNATPGSAKFTSTFGASYRRLLSGSVNLVVSGDYYCGSAWKRDPVSGVIGVE